jgi:hypothetical protein
MARGDFVEFEFGRDAKLGTANVTSRGSLCVLN